MIDSKNILVHPRILISGGGTGGHIFPAVSIANEIVRRYPAAKILFVGALGRMEMTRIPEAGYEIVGLPISGIQRKFSLANLALPFKLLVSILKARAIIKEFKPDAAVGTGGFASAPLMAAARQLGIPSLVQEQNSYAGITNKSIGAKADRICVAYKGMEKFFPSQKIRLTGNPVRKDILSLNGKRAQALNEFGFVSTCRTLLIIGGSLGARTINNSILAGLNKLTDAQIQVLWQTGKVYYGHVQAQVNGQDLRQVRVFDFIKNMDMAYAAADVVITRAGALAIAELCVAGKPSILVPSPNVAEDHQTKNAEALAKEGAGILVTDAAAEQDLVSEAIRLIFDEERCAALSRRILLLGKPKATEDIVNELETLIKR